MKILKMIKSLTRELRNDLGCFLALFPARLGLILANSAFRKPKKSFSKPFQIIPQFPLVACILCLSVFAGLEAAALRTILVADTMDISIGRATALDLVKMSQEFNKAADFAAMDDEQVIIRDRDANPSAVLGVIESLQVEEDDTVVFYYSGHGYRTQNKEGNPWPNLYFSLVHEGVDLAYIRDVLEEKNPRFLIVVADVCNNIVSDDFVPLFIKKFFQKQNDLEIVEANYRSLFLETEGTLMISSSSVGEYSWTTMSGGFFTEAFLRSLQQTVKLYDYPEWGGILEKASLLSGYCDQLEQHPQWDFTSRRGASTGGNDEEACEE